MVFHLYSRKTLPMLKDELPKHGVAIYPLSGDAIHDEASLLQAFAQEVPFEVFTPDDLVPPINWNAFGDCLSSGLGSRPETRVAIIWEGADRMLSGNLSLLLDAVERIGREADRMQRYDPPVELRVCLIGDGPNFPDYPGVGPLFGPESARLPRIELRRMTDGGEGAA
jgi:barstar (barnase inhibitor)